MCFVYGAAGCAGLPRQPKPAPGRDGGDFARAAMAEIERREGYEGELLTALENCRAPIRP
ncbi:MAG: hypothetical protein EOP24_34655 [Hyphomicrobiales bacterium]|nr:MAG: hypothetical protein EOP24_34655 [Hyphomicrobiales bacterium]